MRINNITKKAIIGLAIAGMSFALSGCGDSTPVSKPKSDLERYDDANKDLKETANKIKAYDIKQVTEYINKDPKYKMLKILNPNAEANEFQPKGIDIKVIVGYNSFDNMNREKIYTKEEATAAVEAIDNIINSEDRKKLITKLDKDGQTMKEIASKAVNNQSQNLQMKYDSDIRVKTSVTAYDYYPFIQAQKDFSKMIKIEDSSNFWKH